MIKKYERIINYAKKKFSLNDFSLLFTDEYSVIFQGDSGMFIIIDAEPFSSGIRVLISNEMDISSISSEIYDIRGIAETMGLKITPTAEGMVDFICDNKELIFSKNKLYQSAYNKLYPI